MGVPSPRQRVSQLVGSCSFFWRGNSVHTKEKGTEKTAEGGEDNICGRTINKPLLSFVNWWYPCTCLVTRHSRYQMVSNRELRSKATRTVTLTCTHLAEALDI